MGRIKRYGLFLFMGILFGAVPGGAEHLKPFVMPSARASGFGGIHAAQDDDFSAIFSNPASFFGIKKQFSVTEITLSVSGPVFEMLDKAAASSGDISSLVNSDRFGRAGFDVGGPIALGLVNDGFAFGFFNRTAADVEALTTPIGRLLIPTVSEEVLLVGGFSFRVLETLSDTLDLGFLAKGFYRFLLDLEVSADNMFDLVKNGENIQPFQTQFGLGFDLGIKYTYAGIFSVALAGYDVFSPALVTKYKEFFDYGSGDGEQSYSYVQPRLALGVLYRIESEFLERYIKDITVMADYRDFINLFKKDRRHPLLDVSLGVEITLLNILKLRAGMADFMPCGGFGVDMTIMKLDAAVRGKTLGKNPGELTTFALDIGLLFRY